MSGTSERELFVGIDVQVARGCAWVALDRDARWVAGGWSSPGAGDEIDEEIAAAVRELEQARGTQARVAIDAPRRPLPAPREAYWDGAKRRWRARRRGDRGLGRHCEVVVAALRLGRPQWTPLAGAVPEWMRLGFRLFDTLGDGRPVDEVFPSATYAVLAGRDEPLVTLSLGACARGPKDALDAATAALTIREHERGRGMAVGGGDGLGTIVLPAPVDAGASAGVLFWPADAASRR